MDAMDEDSPSTAQGQPSPLSHTGPARPPSASTSASTPNPIAPPPPRSAGAGSGTPASAGAAQGDSSSNTTSAGTPSAPSSTTPAGAATASGAAPSKRRRGLGIVTPNACTECRKKRAKCDGQKPCGRCRAQKDVDCVYEVPVRQSKENLRTEIEQLRRSKNSSDSIFGALRNPVQGEEVLRRLRGGQSIESISEWLGSQPSPGSAALPGLQPPGFGPISGVGSGLTPLASFSGASAHGYTPSLPSLAVAVGHHPHIGAGLGGPSQGSTLSPITTAHPQSARPELDPNSPWATHSHFSAATTSHDPARSSRSDSHPDVHMSWGGSTGAGPPQTRVGRWVEDSVAQMHGHGGGDSRKYHGLDQVLAPEMPQLNVPATTWTTITSDTGLAQHLLALYFCWEYPTFASLSKEHFLKDYSAGRSRYCSSILVNALLALGCRFSSQPSTLANPNDPYSSGDHFFKECQRLFYQEDDHHNLTTIQALGIMSIREASCGRDSESWYYAGQSIRLAVEMGLHRVHDTSGDSDEVAVQAATFWGAFSLDHAWSLATGSLPQCSCFPHLPPKPAILRGIEASFWIPYTDDGTPFQRSCEQPSNVRSVYKCFCELSELVHESLYILHSPGRPLTSRDLINIYTDFLNWYDNIPEVLRLGHNFTPAVLFAHMYYHFAILLLFRPLIKLRIIGSSISPRDVCTQAAQAIQGLVHSYSQLYTLRRTPSFVPYFVLTSSIMQLAIAASTPQSHSGGQEGPQLPGRGLVPQPSEDVAKTINQGIADLTEMAPCHHFAEQALNILRFLAKKWNIEVNVDIDRRVEGEKKDEGIQPGSGSSSQKQQQQKQQKDEGGGDRRIELGSRISDHSYGTRHMTSSLNFFAPDIQEKDYISTLRGVSSSAAEESSPFAAAAAAAPTTETMENPLFWPFPMQGRPILPRGELLKEAGFELLQ